MSRKNADFDRPSGGIGQGRGIWAWRNEFGFGDDYTDDLESQRLRLFAFLVL